LYEVIPFLNSNQLSSVIRQRFTASFPAPKLLSKTGFRFTATPKNYNFLVVHKKSRSPVGISTKKRLS